jgi:hypothetical protein
MPQCDYKYLFFTLWRTCLVLKVGRRERDLNPRDLHRSQAFDTWKVPGLRPTRLGDPGSESTQFFLYINY